MKHILRKVVKLYPFETSKTNPNKKKQHIPRILVKLTHRTVVKHIIRKVVKHILLKLVKHIHRSEVNKYSMKFSKIYQSENSKNTCLGN